LQKKSIKKIIDDAKKMALKKFFLNLLAEKVF
jgi:hypothetical protein